MNSTLRRRCVFTSSYTTDGFHTFIPELLETMEKVFILKGTAGSGKSTFIRLLGESLFDQGFEVEYWISATEPFNPEGIYLPQLQAAVVNGSLPVPIDPRYPGGIGEIINLGDYQDKDLLVDYRQDMSGLVQQVEEYNHKAGAALKEAGRVKDEINKAAARHLDLGKLQDLIHDLAARVISREAEEKHYFASAVTAEGMINYIDELSHNCRKRYIFKGPAGSGKSTVISQLALIFKKRGYVLEYYHCGLNREAIVMLLLPSFRLAFIDAGNGGVVTRPGDEVIDLGDYLNDYQAQTSNLQNSQARRNYETLLNRAGEELGNVYLALKELKKIYAQTADFDKLEARRGELLKRLTASFRG